MAHYHRISVPINEEFYARWKHAIPDNVKSEVVRRLVDLLFQAQRHHNTYVVEDLLNGRLTLVKRESS